MKQPKLYFDVNQRPGQLTLSRLNTSGVVPDVQRIDPGSSWGLDYFYRNLTLHDQYGNTGQFYVEASFDGNTLWLNEGQTS